MDDIPRFRPGLEDVIAAETALSWVDGEGGRLIVRGHPIEELATRRFEDVCGLLWDGRLPDAARADALRSGLGEGRRLAFRALPRLGAALEREDAMEALRAGVAALEAGEMTRVLDVEAAIDNTDAMLRAEGVRGSTSRGTSADKPKRRARSTKRRTCGCIASRSFDSIDFCTLVRTPS